MENTNRMQLIGMALMFLLFITWVRLTGPTQEQIAEHQRVQDSILLAQEQTAGNTAVVNTPQTQAADFAALPDSVQNQRLVVTHGPFAAAASGSEETFTLENDKMTVVFSSKGGKIKEVTLKEHFKILTDSLKRVICIFKARRVEIPLLLEHQLAMVGILNKNIR